MNMASIASGGGSGGSGGSGNSGISGGSGSNAGNGSITSYAHNGGSGTGRRASPILRGLAGPGTTRCSNCGDAGHAYRDCVQPVLSFGVIAYRYPAPIVSPELPTAAASSTSSSSSSRRSVSDGDAWVHVAAVRRSRVGTGAPVMVPPAAAEPEFLLIRRKDSLAYVELLRGRYDAAATAYVASLVEGCTLDERARLAAPDADFEALWSELWSHTSTRQFRLERAEAGAKFAALRSTGALETALDNATTAWTEPEWGLPKGRRNGDETDFAAAAREFTEETGVPFNRLAPLHAGRAPLWLQEDYVGTNGVTYRHRYLVARCEPDQAAAVHADDAVQAREVSAVAWLPLHAALARLRPTYAEKADTLRNAATLLSTVVTLAVPVPATYHPPDFARRLRARSARCGAESTPFMWVPREK